MKSRALRSPLGIAAAAVLIALAGCAHHQTAPGVPIEERPSPPQPGPDSTSATPPGQPGQFTPPDTTTQAPPPHVMTPSAEESMRALVVRDTTTVSAALKRCAGQSMLPEQQTTWDAAMDLLAQVREALARGDLAQARSLARNAKQLVASLDCP